jgi:hypothetical protein
LAIEFIKALEFNLEHCIGRSGVELFLEGGKENKKCWAADLLFGLDEFEYGH